MDIGKFKNNEQYYDDSYVVSNEVIIELKESPEFNLHIDEMYFADIFGKPVLDGKPWIGFTRDYCECRNGWDEATEMDNIDEYIWDMLRYKDREFDWEETPEVFNLILEFLTYAKETGQTVIVEKD